MQNDTSAWFINTDSGSLGGVSPHDAWFAHGCAFSGGALSFGEKLGRLQVGDLLLMWANGSGVVGIGRVTAPWDGRTYDQDAKVYVEGFQDAGQEYRIAVDWFLDLRERPLRTHDITTRGIRNGNPRQSLCRIARVDAVLATVADLRRSRRAPVYPDEVDPQLVYVEGERRVVPVNAHERDPRAREACLAHHGPACMVCGVDFGDSYGPEVAGLIHVHHLAPLSDAQGPRQVDPTTDLVPVCPNCHAVIHARRPPYTPEEVRRMLGRWSGRGAASRRLAR